VCNASITDNATESGYETGSGVTSSYVEPRGLSSSMNTINISSTGGVQLSQATSGLSEWQAGPRTRTRKAPSSNAGVNGSISSANTVPRPVIPANNSDFAKVRAYRAPKAKANPPEPFAATSPKAQKSEPEEELSVTDSAWNSEDESSDASTEVPEDPNEIEVIWDQFDSEDEDE
jgi:hypothetical protein